MKSGIIRFIAVLSSAFMLAACTATSSPPVQPAPQSSASPAAAIPASPAATQAAAGTSDPVSVTAAGSDDMTALMPGKTGFQWQYFGFAEYAMTMKLKSISQTNSVLSYSAEGSVADMSGGAAKGDFSVKVSYKVMPGVLMQNLTGSKSMDCAMPDIELIRSPLVKGTQWVQAVKDRYGKNVNLACTITDVKTVNGNKVYSVYYKVDGSDYYEKREITEGMGVTAYDKLYMYDTGREEIGYRLYTPEIKAEMAGWDRWLPKLNAEYTYFGLAEYGHKGTFVKVSSGNTEAIYEFRGVYDDATGNNSKFVVRYYVDLMRGTVTEQAVSNERGKAEVNSKLHNLVILKFPLSMGEHWTQKAKLNGKEVDVLALITEYDDAKGVVKVRYTAKNAAGYYNNTYIEVRSFEKGYGMTGFGNLMTGSIGITATAAKDPKKLEEAITQHMFGYSLNKTLVK